MPIDLASVSTPETRRAGALAAAEAKRDKKRSFRERLAVVVDRELDGMLESFKNAWMQGDWRAAQALMHEAHGLPVQRVEGDRTVTVVVQSVVPGEAIDAVAEEVEAAVLEP